MMSASNAMVASVIRMPPHNATIGYFLLAVRIQLHPFRTFLYSETRQIKLQGQHKHDER